MSGRRRLAAWGVGLVVAIGLTGWQVRSTTEEVRGPDISDLTRVPAGQWRQVNVGKADRPVWVDYRIVEIRRHPSLSPRAKAGTSSADSNSTTASATRKAPEGGTFAVVVSECRCPVSEDLTAPSLRVVDRAGREWSADGVSTRDHEEYGPGMRSTQVGDEEEGRVEPGLQRLVDLFEVAADAKDLDVVVSKVKRQDSAGNAEFAVWQSHG